MTNKYSELPAVRELSLPVRRDRFNRLAYVRSTPCHFVPEDERVKSAGAFFRHFCVCGDQSKFFIFMDIYLSFLPSYANTNQSRVPKSVTYIVFIISRYTDIYANLLLFDLFLRLVAFFY